MAVSNPAKVLFRHAKALGRTAGLAITPLRDVDQRVIGVEFRANTRRSSNITGSIVNATHDGQDVSFFVANEADVIQSEHRRGRFYEREELEIIGRHFAGGVFFDAGANVGNHSVYALKFLGASRVIAVEPNPEAFNILRVNIALNNLADRFTHHAVGLSDKPGAASMYRMQDNLGGTYLNEAEDGELLLSPGDDLVGDTPVSFVKIDCEGMELAVILGLQRTLDRDRPAIFVEVMQSHVRELLAWAGANGYEPAEEFSRYAVSVNYLLKPKRP